MVQIKTIFFVLFFLFAFSQKVVIFGSGIGGLTSALELLEKNPKFDIHIFEKLDELGGKSRSNHFPGTGRDGRRDLDGEHGFRIFPAFYENIFDTLAKIPYQNGRNVSDNLVKVTHFLMTNDRGLDPVLGVAPNNVIEFIQYVRSLLDVARAFKIPEKEMGWFTKRVWLMSTTCKKRYDNDYDSVSYWKFMHAEELSHQTRMLVVHGLTKVLFASEGKIASLRTMGLMMVRLLFGTLVNQKPWISLLKLPTNDVMIHPWINHLKKLGVKFYPSHELVELISDKGKIVSAIVKTKSGNIRVQGDHYISAIPGEKMARVVTPALARAAPSLSQLNKLIFMGMNGLQFYLKEDIPVVRGHIHAAFSKWSLAIVSQKQFWDGYDWTKVGDGRVKGIISICISAWDVKGETDGPSRGKPAKECTKGEIIEEVWYQLHLSLPKIFPREWRSVAYLAFLDPAIRFHNNTVENDEPLYIDSVNATLIQPKAKTELSNLFMASDYIYTYTALASMEAANEAGRRATNELLKSINWNGPFSKVYDFAWPEIYKYFVDQDCERYEQGLPPIGWYDTPRNYSKVELDSNIQKLIQIWNEKNQKENK